MRTKRTYKLVRLYWKRFGIGGKMLVFDLWNADIHSGYEMHVIILHDIKKAYNIAYKYLGQTHTIVAWDELVTCIKADIIKYDERR